MERKGVYRKGRAGHVRNMSSFRIYREHMKKWRLPLTALLALVVVFATAPAVGDELQTSLLTAEETQGIKNVDSVQGRKVLLDAVNDFIAECDRVQVRVCMEDGRHLATQIASVSGDPAPLVASVEEFASRYEEVVAERACQYDLASVVSAQQVHQKTLEKLVEDYGEVLDMPGLESEVMRFKDVTQTLTRFAEMCDKR